MSTSIEHRNPVSRALLRYLFASNKRKRFFFLFTGEDWQILNKAKIEVQEHFILNGFRVFGLIIAIFLSLFIFFYNCDHGSSMAVIVDLLVSFFITGVFSILYVLTLFTLSPNILPEAEVRYRKRFGKWFDKYSENFAIFIRLLFISLIGFCLSKPLELELYNFCHDVNHDKIIDRIHTVHAEWPWIWLVTLGFVFAFLYPILKKYTSRDILNSFYELKRNVQHRIILDEQNIFLMKYTKTFAQKYKKKIIVESQYSNPPFNTRKKKLEAQFLTETDFLNDYLEGEL